MTIEANYCLFFIQHWSTCMSKSEWASWAQATFSVLAILGAFWIARHQIAKQQRFQRMAERAAAEVVAAAVDIPVATCLDASKRLKDSCTHCLKNKQPLSFSIYVDLLERAQLPTESQILLLTPEIPAGSVALAQARHQLDFLREMLHGFVESHANRRDEYIEFPILVLRQWSKLLTISLGKAHSELLTLRAQKVSVVRRLWRDWYFSRDPQAQQAALQQGITDMGLVDSEF